MGWCRGTEVFDDICEAILDSKLEGSELIEEVIYILQANDWDCELESEYVEHPIVKDIFIKMYPDYYEER